MRYTILRHVAANEYRLVGIFAADSTREAVNHCANTDDEAADGTRYLAFAGEGSAYHANAYTAYHIARADTDGRTTVRIGFGDEGAVV